MTAVWILAAAVLALNSTFVAWGYLHNRARHGKGE